MIVHGLGNPRAFSLVWKIKQLSGRELWQRDFDGTSGDTRCLCGSRPLYRGRVKLGATADMFLQLAEDGCSTVQGEGVLAAATGQPFPPFLAPTPCLIAPCITKPNKVSFFTMTCKVPGVFFPLITVEGVCKTG